MQRSLIIVIATACGLGIAAAETVIIPTDYPTIQEGIDSRNDGDTLPVKPWIYYENINLDGHNIVVGSFFAVNGDQEYIENTVIDGDSAATVVTCESNEDSTAVISGLAITNGVGPDGGGIKCSYSYPTIVHNIITENRGNEINHGAGLCLYYSGAKITDNIISRNVGCWGGGIFCLHSFVLIRKNRIIENRDLW